MKIITQQPNLWETAKVVLREKFIELHAYIEEKKISNKQSNFTFKVTKKEQPKSPKLVEK